MKIKPETRKVVDSVEDDSAPYNPGKDFTTLEAWKKARTVKLYFYNSVIPTLPIEEKFSLDTQIRKASISITANIAEGYGRYHYQEGLQFYRIARASLYELKDHLISALDLQYISRPIFDNGIELIEESKKTLNGYIGFVKRQKTNFK